MAQKIKHEQALATVLKTADDVFNKYGPPFLGDGSDIALNDRAVAVLCSTTHMIRYEPGDKAYERYDAERGQWRMVNELAVERKLDELLIGLGEKYEQQDFVRRISSSKLNSLSKMLRHHDVRVEMVSTESLIHASNGVIDLSENRPKLMPHGPEYPFHTSSEIKFEPKAGCPKFTKSLLVPALVPADIALLQKYCGSMLLGPNTCHGLMIIRGTAGGGKSTLVSIVEKIIGEQSVAYLRTSHLGGRFETSAFVGKRLLVGKDVPGNTLAAGGARLLKSLVGNDLMQAEVKYNPEKKALRGDFHVMIVSNNNLHIALDGDTEAWSRRLLMVDFVNVKPGRPIPNLAERLVAEEGSGILNWLIAGALAYRAEMNKSGHLQLTDAQHARIKTLLQDSDNVTEFVKNRLIGRTGHDVSSGELWLGYHKTCRDQKWTPVPMHKFQTRVPELMAQVFSTTRRNDILREGKAVRGFKNVTLV